MRWEAVPAVEGCNEQMGDYQNTKIVIIGMGYLMEYIQPCYRALLGEERLKRQMLATTADPEGLAEKAARLGFSVLLNQNMKALEMIQPDIILFAPPPHVAYEIAERDIRPYYDTLRQRGGKLPDFYAFTPKPVGAVYGEILGRDVAIVNIIPNMFTRIGNRWIPEEGRTLITFAEGLPSWSTDKQQRLFSFLSPLGPVVAVAPEQLTTVLTSFSASRVITDILLTCSEIQNVPLHELAGEGRGALFTRFDSKDDKPQKESYGEIGAWVSRAWLDGVYQGALAVGISEQTAQNTLHPLYNVRLHKLQVEDIDSIQREMRKNATPGGIFEKACMLYTQMVDKPLRKFLGCAGDNKSFEQYRSFETELKQLAQNLFRELLTHANSVDTLVKEKELRPEHHAVLFGFLSRRCISRFGEEGERAVLACAEQYGRERGQRMAKRCLQNGEQLTMFNYLAYGEWRALKGEAEVKVVAYEPEYKTISPICPWCEGWKKYDLLKYGSLYCLAVDCGVVEGFNSKLSIQINQLQSRGDPVCEFVWCQASVHTPEDKKKLDTKKKQLTATCAKDFRYHTGHLYHVFLRGMKERFGEAGQEICEEALFDYRRTYGMAYAFPVLEDYHGVD